MIKWIKKLFCRRPDNKYTFISIVYGIDTFPIGFESIPVKITYKKRKYTKRKKYTKKGK